MILSSELMLGERRKQLPNLKLTLFQPVHFARVNSSKTNNHITVHNNINLTFNISTTVAVLIIHSDDLNCFLFQGYLNYKLRKNRGAHPTRNLKINII